jgi:anionic cell wall polymer biosynthesis LytR-Cps2A-Psr (LCP) family protein
MTPFRNEADGTTDLRRGSTQQRFFSEITSKRVRRGSFPSVPRLVKAIADFVEEYNTHAKPFVWTKSAKKILDKIEKCHTIYGSGH